MKNKSKGMKILMIVFAVLMVADIISTLRLGNLVQYLEINPFYSKLGIVGITLLVCGLMYFVYWRYSKATNCFTRYVFLSMMVMICLLKVFIIINNVQVGNDPPTVEQAQSITQEVKDAQLRQHVSSGIFPYLVGIISYIFFSIDHSISVKQQGKT